MFNRYYATLYNIHTIINHYGFKYHWKDVTKEKFFNYTFVPIEVTPSIDKYLAEIHDDRLVLGENILQRGMFCPFFFFRQNNQNLLFMGKHRLQGLLKYHKQCKFDKKFLFIEYYSDPWGKKENAKKIPENYPKLYYWEDEKIYKARPKTYADLNWMLVNNGDKLSQWLYDWNIQPSPIINDEKLFEEFINKPFDLPLEINIKEEIIDGGTYTAI